MQERLMKGENGLSISKINIYSCFVPSYVHFPLYRYTIIEASNNI